MRRQDEIERELEEAEEAEVRAPAPRIDDMLIRPGEEDVQARLFAQFEQMTVAEKQAAIAAREQAAFEKALADIAKLEGKHVSENNALPVVPVAAALTESESAARKAAQVQAEEDFKMELARVVAESFEAAQAQERPVSIVQAAPRSNQGQNEDKHSDESERLAARKAAQAKAEADFKMELARVVAESFEAAQAQERPVSIVQAAPRSNQGQNEDKHSNESERLAARRAAQAQAEEDFARVMRETALEAAQAQERPVSMIFSGAPSVQPRRTEATSSTSFAAAPKPATSPVETKVRSEAERLPVAAPKPVTPAAAPTPVVATKAKSEAELRKERQLIAAKAAEERAAKAKAAKEAQEAAKAREAYKEIDRTPGGGSKAGKK